MICNPYGASCTETARPAAVLKAANLGDDADTTAAICGQVAGAFYGESGIPGKWLDKLVMLQESQCWPTAFSQHTKRSSRSSKDYSRARATCEQSLPSSPW